MTAKIEEGSYRDGEREGPWSFWDPESPGFVVERRYRRGRPVGAHFHRRDGQIEEVEIYAPDVGRVLQVDYEGVVPKSPRGAQHIPDDAYALECPPGSTPQRDMGSTLVACETPEGTRNGPWKELWNSGVTFRTGEYENGKRSGAFTYFDPKGERVLVEHWEDGVLQEP